MDRTIRCRECFHCSRSMPFLERKWLRPEVGDHLKLVRSTNPLLFDFLLKRHLRIDAIKFGRDVFETARIFRRTT